MPYALSAYLFGALGLFLVAAPWSGVWESFVLPFAPTAWGPLVRSGWMRGFVSGLGVLNLAVALADGTRLWRSVAQGAGREP